MVGGSHPVGGMLWSETEGYEKTLAAAGAGFDTVVIAQLGFGDIEISMVAHVRGE